MKKHAILIVLVVFFVSLILISNLMFSLLEKADTPPEIGVVQEQFQNRCADISLVVDYLAASGYENVYINDREKDMLADFVRMPIDDLEIYTVITDLFESGYCTQINKIGNTIYLLQWKGIRDIGCGVAYSINGIDLPKIQYATELVPLSEDSWYYYVADYNETRSLTAGDELREH